MISASKLTDYFRKKMNLSEDAILQDEKINARELIVPERIDLIAKIKYVEHYINGYDMSFATRLYKKHIEVFSKGTYKEPGSNTKVSFEAYLDTFNKLIDSIKNNSFDESISVIPVGANNIILDGAHRTAIAAYLNLDVTITRFEHVHVDYGIDFFTKGLLQSELIDYLAIEYCKNKTNTFFACLWPIADDPNKVDVVERVLNENDKVKVIHQKEVEISYSALRNFIVQIYNNQPWLGNIDNRFKGVDQKVEACYKNNSKLRGYILEADGLDDVLRLKEDIREIYQLGKHAIHITDNQAETIQIANILLNENSLHLLKYGNPFKYKVFNKRLLEYKRRIAEQEHNLDYYIIDSSSVLSLYGLREANDIDFISNHKDYEKIENESIKSHNDYLMYYKSSMDELLWNPSNFLYFSDIKFTSINQLMHFKSVRQEKKDKDDLVLIKQIGIVHKSRRLLYLQLINWMHRKKRNLLYSFKVKIKKVLKWMKLENEVRKIYNLLRRR